MSERKIEKVIIALDGMNESEVFIFLKKVSSHFAYVKVGMELYYQHGPTIVQKIYNEFGLKVFLDLKLHDIPNTVSSSIKSLKNLPVHFLTVHISGGYEMLIQAKESAKTYLPQTKLLGVGLLTSLNPQDLNRIWGIDESRWNESFSRLIDLCEQATIDGLILSPHELTLAKNRKLIKICPGIRFSDEIAKQNTQDQKRVGTPESAIKDGADFLVMGRSLTKSTNLDQRVLELTHL
ncbi:MAG: orotidine-5'-phosphate decarboxylase [Bacteriovoracaceae bacterium]